MFFIHVININRISRAVGNWPSIIIYYFFLNWEYTYVGLIGTILNIYKNINRYSYLSNAKWSTGNEEKLFSVPFYWKNS